MTRLRLLVIPLAALALVIFGGYWAALYHRFPIDVETVSVTGETSLVARHDYDAWIHRQIAAAAWWRGGLFVRHMILARGALFTFTTSGRVFVLEPPQDDSLPICLDTFWWTGDPRKFPFPNKNYGQG